MRASMNLLQVALLAGLAVPAAAAFAQETTEPGGTQAPAESAPAASDPKAQEEAGDDVTELDTIEVTASKRIKAQRDIPGSVGAIRGTDLEAMRAQGMKDYFKLVPGVLYSDQGNEESVPVIRGIATSLSFGATPVTTGIYMDDMPFADLFSPSSIPDLNPFDLERVEILKGPQGTLFGSGALAGAVRYIVQKPNHGIWEGKAMGTISQSALSEDLSPVYAGAVNVPLFGDRVAFRAVALRRNDAGIYDMGAVDGDGNTLRNDKDADAAEQSSARVLGSWRVTEELSLSGFYFNHKTHQGDFGYADAASVDDPGSKQFPFASPREHEFGGGNLSGTYDFPWLRVLASYNKMTKHNYQDQHQEFGFDLQQQQDDEYAAIFGDDIDGNTKEVRLISPEGGDSPWEWLVGGSRLAYGNQSFQYSYIGPDMPDPHSADEVSDAEILTAQVFATTDQTAYETAYFGEVTRKLGDFWELTAGGRRYETRLRADTVLCGAQVLALFGQQCYPEHFDDRQTGVNPKFSVRYLHNRHVQVYVLAAKGFQFGGVQINPPAPGFPESAEAAGYKFEPYESSKLWNYELGLRTEWLDRRLRLDTTLYYQDWKDLQMTIQVPLQGTNVPFNIIANVARAHSEGAEIALEILPFTGTKFTSVVSIMSAVTDVLFDKNAGDGGVKPGTRLPGAPRFQWASVASYEHTVPYFTSWIVNPALTYVFVGEATDQIRPTGTIGDYGTLDARLALTMPSSRFQPEISLGMNNLTDVRGSTFHIGGNTATQGLPYNFEHFVQPRTSVLSVSLRY